MSIAGQSNLDTAQAVYSALYQEAFMVPAQGYVADEFAMKVPCEGTSLTIPVVSAFPAMSQWVASKASKDLRAYTQNIPIVSYEATINLPRLQVTGDKSGVIASALKGFLAQGKLKLDKILVDKFLANTWLGYDGVSLLNDSHPNSNSTGDNLTTSALSFSTYRAGVEAMADFTDEDGTPLHIAPTHLLVGPAQERIAKEIVGAERPVPLNASGAEAASSVVTAVTLPNVFQGQVKVLVSPLVTGNQWLLAHCGPGLNPFTMAVSRDVEAVVKDGRDMTSDSRFFTDQFYYSLEADIGFGAGIWQCCYGSVTA
jgi:phage major head subunit gpT-like protein